MSNDLPTNSPRSQQQQNFQGLNQIDNFKSNINYKFNDSNKTAMIIGNNNLSNIIFIPRTIKHNMQDYLVTEISEGSFQNLFIQSVQFEANSEVRTIGKNAFAYSMITNITIPQHVTEICENAFFNCQLLKQVNFQENSELNKIGEKSFSHCAIENINIPSHVKEIFPKIFINYQNLQCKYYNNDIIITKTDSKSEEFDNLIFARYNIVTTIIPPFVKRIGESVFTGSLLEYIVIPSNVTEICTSAFSLCNSLEKVEFMPDSKLNI